MMPDFWTVTELSGDDATREQVERMCHRYVWASSYCKGQDVIEVACGMGQGLGLLLETSRSVRAGDYDEKIQQAAQEYYGSRLAVDVVDAQNMPYADNSADVIILFEALYYLPEPDRFVKECERVLRACGRVLIANANKDLVDFNPSPFSHTYHGVVELGELFRGHGFNVDCYGYLSCREITMRQRVLRGAKVVAVKCGLMPKTMKGKKLLKRLVFGRLVAMPAEIKPEMIEYAAPGQVPLDKPDRDHKVIYCVATRGNSNSEN